MGDFQKQYDQLCSHAKETSYLVSSAALLEWDQQTKMPAAAGGYRSDQVTYLAKLIHQRETDPVLGELLSDLSESSHVVDAPTSSDVATTVRALGRRYQRQVKVPSDLVQALARAASAGQQVWVDARKQNDFRVFQPALEQIIQLKQQQADAIGQGDCRYDSLLDEYEPDAKTEEVAAVLESLRDALVPMLQRLSDSGKQVDSSVLRREFSIEQQRAFVKEVSAKIGFDYQRGRLDVTHHPFCTEMGPDDCRITTRYDETFFSSAFFGTLHEAGHGMYEQGLRGDQYGLPSGQYCSLGIHESQSRLWENLVGRSESFWQHFFPKAKSCFPKALSNVRLESFYAAVNEVVPSLIRVEADEVTYNLHIIIRFELERALIDGDLSVADLPGAWNEKYLAGLGVAVPDDASGVLQDVHWSAGLIGYFPTYSLGNLYASQLFDAAESQLGQQSERFRVGDFAPLREWLNDNIHCWGKCRSPGELCVAATGAELSHEHLVRHLNEKINKIYDLPG